MEAIAWIMGEKHSDKPKCVSPMIGSFIRSWQDNLDDDNRNRLIWPLLPVVIGTNDGKEAERAEMCSRWIVETYAPAFLRLVPELQPHAEKLAAAWNAAREAAWEAAGNAAGSAARAAARGAAGEAVWNAAGEAAWNAARAAAWNAARSAARSAARGAAGDALAPTVNKLQGSAQDLVRRMAAVGGNSPDVIEISRACHVPELA